MNTERLRRIERTETKWPAGGPVLLCGSFRNISLAFVLRNFLNFDVFERTVFVSSVVATSDIIHQGSFLNKHHESRPNQSPPSIPIPDPRSAELIEPNHKLVR